MIRLTSPEPDVVITRDQHVWGFGTDMAPVATVRPGAVVRLETNV